MRILASTNWTPGSSGRRTTNFEILDTAYTIELDPDHFPYMTKEEKVMPGGWTGVIVSKFEEWVQVDNIWVPKSINTDVLFQDGIRSAPISRQLFVLNPA